MKHFHNVLCLEQSERNGNNTMFGGHRRKEYDRKMRIQSEKYNHCRTFYRYRFTQTLIYSTISLRYADIFAGNSVAGESIVLSMVGESYFT